MKKSSTLMHRYVYQCIKDTKDNPLMLSDKNYQVGDYISYDGSPVKDLTKAYLFKKIGQYSLEDMHEQEIGKPYWDWTHYFQLLKVVLKPIKTQVVKFEWNEKKFTYVTSDE